MWSVLSKGFLADSAEGLRVNALQCARLEWTDAANGQREFRELPGSEFEIRADLVLLAAGFVHTEHGALVRDLQLEINQRGNIGTDRNFMTSNPGVFAAGDCVQGASLVVTAISQGRQLAESVHRYLS